MFREKFNLGYATLITALIKLSIFAVGVSLIGFLTLRSSLPSCSESRGNLPTVFAFNQWPAVEAYTDYRDLYLRCLIAPFLSGHGPYQLGTIVYNYPPLFLYLIAGFAYLGNLIWIPAVPLVLFDILTVVPVYLISKEFVFHGNSRLAFVISVFWAANPLNLFYNDLMWLNTAPTTFFLILSVYLFLKKKWLFASLALAVSTGLKQVSIVLFPVFLILLWRATGFSKKVLVYALSYTVVLLAISAPYMLTLNDAKNYFWSLGFAFLGLPPGASNSPPEFSNSIGDPVRITTFLGNYFPAFVSKSYQYLDYFLVGAFAIFLIYLITYSLYIVREPAPESYPRSRIARIKAAFVALRNVRSQVKIRRTFSSNEILVYSLVGVLIFFALFGRGVYKYYFASITPLGIPLFRNKVGALIFEGFSLALFLAPREVSPWMAVLLLTFVPRMLMYDNPTKVETHEAN